MTTVIRLVVLVLTAVFTAVSAQEFQGVATYKTHRNIDIKIDSTNKSMTPEIQKKMNDMLKKQFQKTFLLTFNKEASVYKEDVDLDAPQIGGGDGMNIVVMGNGGSDVLYKNTKENRFSYQRDTYGKIFLIKDNIEPIEWKMGSETKYIGEYQCYKATYTKMVEKPRTITSEDEEDVDIEKEPEMEERTVTAWFTPEIPVNNGPDEYQGLPGLILEVHDGKLTVICSKIVLNPDSDVVIKEPQKGKEVNQEKYDEIMDKKAKEMMEQFKPRKGARPSEGFQIRIGG